MRKALSSLVSVRQLPHRGRGVIATRPIRRGEALIDTVPMAAVLKSSSPSSTDRLCSSCFTPIEDSRVMSLERQCTDSCAHEHERGGGALLDRVDLSPLHALHREQSRKFPLIIGMLLSSLLAEIKQSGKVPESWAPLELCYAELHDEAAPQVEAEHHALLTAFAAAGLANEQTLQLFMPLSRYKRLLGAAQLNAFELTLSHGASVSALLPGVASCFNHSCSPNVLISCGASTHVSFVAGEDVAADEELCISYLDVEQSVSDRRHLLLHKYGFECNCERCVRESGQRL